MGKIVQIQEDSDFGPAMRKLDIQQQMFVCILFQRPKSLTWAAQQAGYESETRAALRVKAHRLLRNPKVAEAVKEESRRRTQFLLPKAQSSLEDLLDNPNHADHFKAIKMVRDDGGVTTAVQRLLKIEVEVTQKEKIEAIRQWAVGHNLDPVKLLGYDPGEPETTDAEFEEVDSEAEMRELGII